MAKRGLHGYRLSIGRTYKTGMNGKFRKSKDSAWFKRRKDFIWWCWALLAEAKTVVMSVWQDLGELEVVHTNIVSKGYHCPDWCHHNGKTALYEKKSVKIGFDFIRTCTTRCNSFKEQHIFRCKTICIAQILLIALVVDATVAFCDAKSAIFGSELSYLELMDCSLGLQWGKGVCHQLNARTPLRQMSKESETRPPSTSSGRP